MSIPKENRQQMINLMYLVLTALLALNVSAEILNAFRTINKSLVKSNVILDNNVATTFKAFSAKRAKEPANQQIAEYESRSSKVMAASKTLQDYIKQLQAELVEEADGPGEDGAPMKAQDQVDISTRYFIKEKKKGYELATKIADFKKAILELCAAEDKDIVSKEKIAINTDPQKKGGDWALENFFGMPPIASYTMLTKALSDVKTTEGQMVNYFYQKLGDATPLEPDAIVFDKFSAQITSPSAYILQGETFEASLSLAATSSKSAGTVTVNVNGQNIPVDPTTGIAKYKASPGVGEHPLRGSISVRNDRTGKVNSYPLPEFKYTVAAPFATVSPTKMNVFYIGVDNPVQVSAAGVANSKLQVGIDQGSITGSGGQYTVRVTTQSTSNNVSVSANGKSYGKFPFRVKMIPNPQAECANMPGGRVNAAVMKAQTGVIAKLYNFDFDAKFEVLSFNMFYQPKLQDPGIASTTGPYFSAAQKAFIAKAKPGDIFYIEEIKVRGPDGNSRKIPGIAFKID